MQDKDPPATLFILQCSLSFLGSAKRGITRNWVLALSLMMQLRARGSTERPDASLHGVAIHIYSPAL
jgi:hypothetical protein